MLPYEPLTLFVPHLANLNTPSMHVTDSAAIHANLNTETLYNTMISMLSQVVF